MKSLFWPDLKKILDRVPEAIDRKDIEESELLLNQAGYRLSLVKDSNGTRKKYAAIHKALWKRVTSELWVPIDQKVP